MVVLTMPFKIAACGLSDIGLVRQNNEDVWGEIQDYRLYAIADGMGGHRAGEVAAREAINALFKELQGPLSHKRHISMQKMRDLLMQAFEKVNAKVYQLSREDDMLKGMGTTLCCVYFHEQGVICAHVGDSRIYRMRTKKLEQLSSDHSLLRELIELGQLSEQQASEFLYRNIITKAIGTEPTVEPSIYTFDIASGDIYMMCTDGLSDLVPLEEMESIINKEQSIEKAAHKLVLTAKDKGGFDNITVVLMQVSEHEKKPHISRQ
jgi:PPM family protein phosphatase